VSSIRRFAGCSLLLAAWTAPRGSRWCPASPRAPSWRSSPASPLSRCADSSASPRPGATSSLTPSTARSSTPYPRRLLLQRIRIRGDACDCQDRESDGGGCSVGGGDDQRGWWTRTSPSSLSVSGYCITANVIFLFCNIGDLGESLNYIVCNPATEQWVSVPSSDSTRFDFIYLLFDRHFFPLPCGPVL
jgi:hypothetical protein